MATYSQLFGAGGGGAMSSVVQYEYVTTSKTVTALRDGTLDIFISGGSGSGGSLWGNGFLGGAGAGEAATKRGIPVIAGDVVTVVIGAGGASVTRASAGVQAGNPGSPSSVSGPGFAITVNGGAGGTASTTVPLAGGAGGTGGTGGDVHLAGGAGGDVLAGATGHAIAGGGAVAAIPTPPARRKGGSVTGGAQSRAGGAGVGGVGFSTNAAQSSGGGSGGDATAGTAAGIGPNFLGQAISASPTEYIQSFYSWGVDVFGGGGYSNNAPGPGGGSGGGANTVGPGIFAGGGGAASNTTPPAAIHGAGAGTHAASAAQPSSPGGSGACILVFKAE